MGNCTKTGAPAYRVGNRSAAAPDNRPFAGRMLELVRASREKREPRPAKRKKAL